jgi:hypothetical protein
LQTASTILAALEGAAEAAALAIAIACLGSSAAAVPAAVEAMSGTVLAMLPTMSGAEAGLIWSAALTTLMVTVSRSVAFAFLTNWAAVVGRSALGTWPRASAIVESLATAASAPAKRTVNEKATILFNFISAIGLNCSKLQTQSLI